MHADLLAQHLFCDLLGLKHPVLHLFGQMTNALYDIPATAVVRRNIQGSTGVVLSQRLRFANTLLETRIEARGLADNTQAHIMPVQTFHFAIQRPDKQLHQRADFLRRAIPDFHC